MHRVFLDANVLFSAAWTPQNRLRNLWMLPQVALLSSRYAVEEAARNLKRLPPDNVQGLDALVQGVELGDAGIPFPAGMDALPPKDRPILAAAVAMRATHLLTGDKRDFGILRGQMVHGVLVMSPADYLSAAV